MTIKKAVIPIEAMNDTTNIEVKLPSGLENVDPNARNLTAKIIKIHRMGEVEVKFNSTLDLSLGIDYFKDQMSLKILPAEQRDKYDDFDSESIDFTWNITSFDFKGDLNIKLKFVKPLQISPLIIQDQL